MAPLMVSLVTMAMFPFSAYYNMWKREYPKLKVSRPAEDICNHCFVFANRHRYLAKHSTLTEALAMMVMTAAAPNDDGDTTAAGTTTAAALNDNGDTTEAATTTAAAPNDDGDTTAAATTTAAALNDDGNTMAAATSTEATNDDDAATSTEATNDD